VSLVSLSFGARLTCFPDIRLRFLNPRQPPVLVVHVRLTPFRCNTRLTDRTPSQRLCYIRRRMGHVHEFFRRLRYVCIHHRVVWCVIHM